jgi:CubicO group peptidase (beta-lactamase class C family)
MGDLLPLFAAAEPAFAPGSRFSYSNEGFVVLGAVVERLTGLAWHEYAKRNIFKRAGMRSTAYLADDSSAPRRAIGYKFARSDPLGLGARVPNWDSLSWRGGSHGGSFSTAADMVRFLQALQSGDLLKPETVATLFDDGPDKSDDYALGFERHRAGEGRTIIGHDGGGPMSGINSDAKMIVESGYVYAVLGNYDAPFAQTLGRDIGAMLAAQ